MLTKSKLAMAAVLILGAASAAQANEPRDEFGGYRVGPLGQSFQGANPVYHPSLRGGRMAYDYAAPTPTISPPRSSAASSDSCARFRSFDPASGTYLGFDGVRHLRWPLIPDGALGKIEAFGGGRRSNLQAFGRRAPRATSGLFARRVVPRSTSVSRRRTPQKGKSPGMETGLFQTGKRAGGLQASPSVTSTRLAPAGSGSPRHSSARFCRRPARRGTLALAHRGLRPGARDVEQGFSFLLGLGLFGGVQALRRERDGTLSHRRPDLPAVGGPCTG